MRDAPIRDAALHYLQAGFTFTPATFDADRAKARALLTPNAQSAYDARTKSDQSDVQDGGRSTTATPLTAGTVSIDGAKATVLGFFNTVSAFAKGIVTDPGPAQPSTALINMVQTDGQWLLDSYTEVKPPR